MVVRKFASKRLVFGLIVTLLLPQVTFAQTSSHAGFNGSRSSHKSDNKKPLEWSDKSNIKWKLNLPGPGASSPIVVGKSLLITCFSGYATDSKNPGNLKNLTRHLICIDRKSGKETWQVKIKNGEAEDSLTRQISDHGYASSTPASDGKYVYSFFGKAGLFCHDSRGDQIWHSPVGNQSSKFKQGSGSSPILFADSVIINASDEARAIIAFDKSNGEETWRTESEHLDGSYITPAIVKTSAGEDILVVSMIGEAWGLNPNNGKHLWKLKTDQGGSVVPTPIGDNGFVYLFGGMGGTTYAVKADSKGELTKSDVIWTSRNGSIVPSPLLHDGNLYWTTMDGIANCIKSTDGTEIYKKRLGTRAGCYASPVLIGQHICFVSRTSGTFVVPVGTDFSTVAHNVFESDSSRFDGTPAIADGRLYLRSYKSIYCVDISQAEEPKKNMKTICQIN